MAQEEKLEEAKRLYKDANEAQRYVLELLFPELKESESEDEKIRKGIIRNLEYLANKSEGFYKDELKERIAWLEKQGEQKLKNESTDTCDSLIIRSKEFPTSEKRDFGYFSDSSNKIEPRFHVGDWIVDNISKDVFLIKSNSRYCTLEDTKGNIISPCLPPCESESHIWSIRDAKDGDVLVHSNFMFDDFIFIYNNTSILQAYCYYSNERNKFIIEDRGHHCPWNMQEVTPATKEQRDTLGKAMADAGYEFDFEKKELKKIEPKFHEGDWIVWENKYYKVNYNGRGYELADQNGLSKSLEYGTIDGSAHLWTIEDANGGDVIATQNKNIFIFKDIKGTSIYDYCGLYFGEFKSVSACVNGELSVELPNDYLPATKEERDVLMKSMADAGYEFDFEKKELNKIEQSHTDIIPEDFEKYVEHLLSLSDGEGHGSPAKVKEISLKLLKLAKIEQNPAWSEEDEKRVESLHGWLDTLVNYIHHDAIVSLDLRRERMQQVEQLKTWLKSIKERYTCKPSDEQIKVCKEVYADLLSAKGFNVGTINSELNRLEEQLKKLKKNEVIKHMKGE